MYSYGPLHWDEQRQDVQIEHTYTSSVPILDVAWITFQGQWMIRRCCERGSEISVLMAQNIYLSLYCKGSKRLFKVCVWEGARDRTWTVIFWPPLIWPSTLCLSRSPDAQPEAQRPTLWVMAFFTASNQHLLWTPIHQGPNPFGLVWLSLPQLLSNWNSNSTVLISVLTELYNSSTSTRSPTRSLKSHV